MCGIFGMYRMTAPGAAGRRHLSALREVAVSQASRGRDACGIGWRDAASPETIGMHKTPGSIEKAHPMLMLARGADAIVGHTRMATHGDASLNINNHPHVFVEGGIECPLVHNGVVFNHESIAKARGIVLRSECDSEIFCRLIESGTGSLIERVRDAVNAIPDSAPAALAMVVPGGVVLARRGNPLWYAVYRGYAYFASTPESLPGTDFHILDDDCVQYLPAGAPRETLALRPYRATGTFVRGSSFGWTGWDGDACSAGADAGGESKSLSFPRSDGVVGEYVGRGRTRIAGTGGSKGEIAPE